MKALAKHLLADVLLYAVLLAAGAVAGIGYESARMSKAYTVEVRDLQRRAASNAAWLRGERVTSEARLGQQVANLQDQLSKEQGQANENHQNFVDSVRNGTVSVRVPIVPASCSAHSPYPATDAPPATQAAHAQLDPAAAANLAAIPHEGDAAIRDLNFCIAQYNQVKAQQDDWLNTLLQLELSHAQTP